MIIEGILSVILGAIGVLVAQLPAASTAPDVAVSGDGFGQALGLAMLFDQGFPVHESIALVATFIAASLLVDLFVVVRAVTRWLPSWITGGG